MILYITCSSLLFFCLISTDLTEPIDLYSEWIDRCEEENYGGSQREEKDGYLKDGHEGEFPSTLETNLIPEDDGDKNNQDEEENEQ